jgi:hypothetical protein
VLRHIAAKDDLAIQAMLTDLTEDEQKALTPDQHREHSLLHERLHDNFTFQYGFNLAKKLRSGVLKHTRERSLYAEHRGSTVNDPSYTAKGTAKSLLDDTRRIIKMLETFFMASRHALEPPA